MTIYLPDDLAETVKEHDDLNVSAVCQDALRRELARREEIAKLDSGMERVVVYVEEPYESDVAFVGKLLHHSDREDSAAYLTLTSPGGTASRSTTNASRSSTNTTRLMTSGPMRIVTLNCSRVSPRRSAKSTRLSSISERSHEAARPHHTGPGQGRAAHRVYGGHLPSAAPLQSFQKQGRKS